MDTCNCALCKGRDEITEKGEVEEQKASLQTWIVSLEGNEDEAYEDYFVVCRDFKTVARWAARFEDRLLSISRSSDYHKVVVFDVE